jgi:hypothetical protein
MPDNAPQIKDKIVSIRVSPRRGQKYRHAADAEGMRLSEWLRYLADRRIDEQERNGATAA